MPQVWIYLHLPSINKKRKNLKRKIMKKNLQKILVLALGLTTTIASAQFSANSTSRIDNTDSDARTVTNRIALSADYGAVHVSSDVYAASDNSATSYQIP